MSIQWDTFAVALAGSPEVLNFEMGISYGCRSERAERWITLPTDTSSLVCVAGKAGVECRARAAPRDSFGCEGWSTLTEVGVPAGAEPLLTVWASALTLETHVSRPQSGSTRAPFGAVTVSAVRLIDGQATRETRLALRSSSGWHLSQTGFSYEEWVDLSLSFDAAATLKSPGWGVVTTTHDGCGQLWTTSSTFRLWREDGIWLTLAGTIDLGTRSGAPAWNGGWRDEVTLGVTPLRDGRLAVRLAVDEGGGDAEEVRERLGIWSLTADGLARLGEAER